MANETPDDGTRHVAMAQTITRVVQLLTTLTLEEKLKVLRAVKEITCGTGINRP